jgi:hypothetical protein
MIELAVTAVVALVVATTWMVVLDLSRYAGEAFS